MEWISPFVPVPVFRELKIADAINTIAVVELQNEDLKENNSAFGSIMSFEKKFDSDPGVLREEYPSICPASFNVISE